MSDHFSILPENTVAIVFNCFEGSVSHYYHFFYGALIPLIEYHLQNPDKKLLITTDVGPFQSTLLEIFTPTVIIGFEMPVIPPGEKFFDDKSMNWIRIKRPGEVILPAYDIFNTDLIRNNVKTQNKLPHLLEIRPTILKFIEDRMPEEYKHMQTFEIVLLERATEQYYIEKSKTNIDKSREIFYTSGKQRRDITNHNELLAGLTASFPSKIGNIILEGKSIFFQFQLFKNAKIVIGQHGAGLANIFFMQPEGYLVEIMSPWGRRGNHFKNLANSLHVNYYKFDLERDIGPVDVNVIIEILHNIYSADRYDTKSKYKRYDDRRYDDRRYDDRRYHDRRYDDRRYDDRRYDDRRYDDRRGYNDRRGYDDRRDYDDRRSYGRSYGDSRYGDSKRDDVGYATRKTERWGGKKNKTKKRTKFISKKGKKQTKNKNKTKKSK